MNLLEKFIRVHVAHQIGSQLTSAKMKSFYSLGQKLFEEKGVKNPK